MGKNIISIRNLGKRYLLGSGGGERYRALRDVIMNGFKGLFYRSQEKKILRELWALNDISFDIEEGQAVGIIGRNGAGKTTLLKLISQITEPTKGVIYLKGRVSSLLEVGTGFHPELTGRENIFMNGAILGMRKVEIKRKFNEIVDFAEIEKFLDTPVKRYSSGMYVRLAFAVAAHLEPEILLIDEVLAVGDAKFQKKCFGKVGQISRQGRTVILVSHNLAAVINLCRRAILLDFGRVIFDGPASQTVQRYIDSSRSGGGEIVWADSEQAPGNEIVRLYSVRVLQDRNDSATAEVDIAKDIHIEIKYRNLKPGTLLYSTVIVYDRMGTLVFASTNQKSVSLIDDPWYERPRPLGVFQSTCCIPGKFLNEGFYSISVALCKPIAEVQIQQEHVVSFQVHDTGEMRKVFYGGWGGVVRPQLAWHTEYLGSGFKNE